MGSVTGHTGESTYPKAIKADGHTDAPRNNRPERPQAHDPPTQGCPKPRERPGPPTRHP